MNINCLYTLTEAQYLEAQRLYMRHKQPWAEFLPYIAGAAGLILLVRELLRPTSHGSSGVISLAGAGAFLLILALTVPFGQRSGLKRRYKVEAPNLTNVRMHMDDEIFETVVPGIGEGRVQWQIFSPWLESKSLIMLINGFTFRPIPKSCLTECEVNELRDFLRARLGEAGTKKPK